MWWQPVWNMSMTRWMIPFRPMNTPLTKLLVFLDCLCKVTGRSGKELPCWQAWGLTNITWWIVLFLVPGFHCSINSRPLHSFVWPGGLVSGHPRLLMLICILHLQVVASQEFYFHPTWWRNAPIVWVDQLIMTRLQKNILLDSRLKVFIPS